MRLLQPDSPRPATPQERPDLLRTADVAALFQVSNRTVSEWARRGRLPCVRTPGGQWRYPSEHIRRLVQLSARGMSDAEAEPEAEGRSASR